MLVVNALHRSPINLQACEDLWRRCQDYSKACKYKADRWATGRR